MVPGASTARRWLVTPLTLVGARYTEAAEEIEERIVGRQAGSAIVGLLRLFDHLHVNHRRPVFLYQRGEVRQGARQWKRYSRRSGKIASKPAETKKAAEKDVASTDSTLTIPASVANANAQLASAEPATGSAQAMTEKANILLASAEKPAEAGADSVVASDQLNDIDRALRPYGDGTTPSRSRRRP